MNKNIFDEKGMAWQLDKQMSRSIYLANIGTYWTTDRVRNKYLDALF